MTTAPPPMRFTRRARTTPLAMLLYGTPGVGKTTQGAAFPGAVVMRLEDGLGTLDVPATDLLTTWADVVATINDALTMAPGTLVVDSLDWLEVLVHAETCARGGKASIEAFGYGKGYAESLTVWREFLSGMTALRDAGWAIVLLAHSQVVRFDDPNTESYDRYMPKLHKLAAPLVLEWVEVVGFMHWETSVRDRENGKASNTRAIGTGHRNIALVETPGYVAKTRYNLPPALRMDADGHNLLTALHTAGAVFPTITTES
jgi:hypothetical protein